MTERILIVTMVALGLGLSIITPSSLSTEAAKGLTWFLGGILSKFK